MRWSPTTRLMAAALFASLPLSATADPEESEEERDRRRREADERERRTRELLDRVEQERQERDRQHAQLREEQDPAAFEAPCAEREDGQHAVRHETREGNTWQECAACGAYRQAPPRPLSRQQRRAMEREKQRR